MNNFNNFKIRLKKKMPTFILFFLQKIILFARIMATPNRNFFCIFCNSIVSGYLTGYLQSNFELTCSKCFSVSRNRLMGEYLKELDLNQYTILHFAPEKCVENLIYKKIFKSYKKVDLHPVDNQEFCNIENIQFSDEQFDMIICSHVLEHVDYLKAISNLKRIIKKNGLIILMFPIIQNWEKTYSNSEIIKKNDREVHFGQFDHLHMFGRDILKLFGDNFVVNEKISFGGNGIKNGINHGETLYSIKRIS
jgi:SAM-dependent methyltransferase